MYRKVSVQFPPSNNWNALNNANSTTAQALLPSTHNPMADLGGLWGLWPPSLQPQGIQKAQCIDIKMY